MDFLLIGDDELCRPLSTRLQRQNVPELKLAVDRLEEQCPSAAMIDWGSPRGHAEPWLLAVPRHPHPPASSLPLQSYKTQSLRG